MNKNRNTPILIALTLLCTTVWCATNAFGGLSLTNIPTLGGDASNEGRCITPDGKYVGGLSGTAKGFFYDVANNYVVQPMAGSGAGKAVTGIAYRTDTNQSPAQLQILLDAESVGWRAYFMTSDAGTNWLRFLTTLDYTLYASPVMNSLAGTTNSDVFLNTYRNSGKTAVYETWGSNLWTSATPPQMVTINKSVSGTDKVYVNGVAATGRIVGYRFDGASATNRNNLWDWPPSSGTSFQWNGLDGTLAGEAWAVSQDGTVIFGRSPITPGTTALYSYKAVVTAAPSPSRTSIAALPEPPRTIAGSGTTRTVVYGCTADGNYAVGYFYPSATLAALWDTSDPNPANWKVTDLTALAAANGVGVPDVFSSLTKAYSVGTNATDLVITGVGVEAITGNTRAFLMTVPKSMAAVGLSFAPKLTFSGSYPAGLTLSYFTEPGTTSHVEYTTDITPPSTWTEISSQTVGIGTTISVPDASPPDQRRFYRVRIDP
jgi:hypothetical protein